MYQEMIKHMCEQIEWCDKVLGGEDYCSCLCLLTKLISSQMLTILHKCRDREPPSLVQLWYSNPIFKLAWIVIYFSKMKYSTKKRREWLLNIFEPSCQISQRNEHCSCKTTLYCHHDGQPLSPWQVLTLVPTQLTVYHWLSWSLGQGEVGGFTLRAANVCFGNSPVFLNTVKWIDW